MARRDIRGRFVKWTEEDKREFWEPRARELAEQVDWEGIYFNDDGVRSYFGSELPDVDIDGPPDERRITVDRVMRLGSIVGYDKLTRALRKKLYMQDLYWNMEENRTSYEWRHRDGGLPGWFWWYHGYFSG